MSEREKWNRRIDLWASAYASAFDLFTQAYTRQAGAVGNWRFEGPVIDAHASAVSAADRAVAELKKRTEYVPDGQ